LVCLVNDLFRNDLLDDICACVHLSRELFVRIPATTHLQEL
jgi:hypothetical protein